MTFAIVPAAGHSTRMGRPKLSLPLGDRTVLEHVVSALRTGGVDQVLVIVGSHVPRLADLASAAGAGVLRLTEPTPDMRSTVERGLDWIEEHFRPQPDEPWLLVPADHPTLDAGVVHQILAVAGPFIVIPVHSGRRGHPTRFAWKHAVGIRVLPAGQGINVFIREHATEVSELPVSNADVLIDLDTPEDYARLVASGFHHPLTNVSS
jgi:molybdenum cofactor cytidylyltransferase